MCKDKGMSDGTFGARVYARDGALAGAYALCVVYKGKFTHHEAAPGDDGVYVVNKKMQFGNLTTIEQVGARCQYSVRVPFPQCQFLLLPLLSTLQ